MIILNPTSFPVEPNQFAAFVDAYVSLSKDATLSGEVLNAVADVTDIDSSIYGDNDANNPLVEVMPHVPTKDVVSVMGSVIRTVLASQQR